MEAGERGCPWAADVFFRDTTQAQASGLGAGLLWASPLPDTGQRSGSTGPSGSLHCLLRMPQTCQVVAPMHQSRGPCPSTQAMPHGQ